MISKCIIFIVGKTSSGKDLLQDLLSKPPYNFNSVCSYTTRPKRRYEEDGVQHYFVSSAEMRKLRDSSNVIAYTKNEETGIEYCATSDTIKEGVTTYIINPDGINWFKKNYTGKDLRTFSIYVDSYEEDICERALKRGDSISTLTRRLDSEREEFEYFRDNKLYDYRLNNYDSKEDFIRRTNILVSKILNGLTL